MEFSKRAFVALIVCVNVCVSVCTVDTVSLSSSFLPFVTATVSNEAAVMANRSWVYNHWSEKAVMQRPTPPSAAEQTASLTNCPHTQQGLVNWHDASTWGVTGGPQPGQNITLPMLQC
jgi:hypothetical protein